MTAVKTEETQVVIFLILSVIFIYKHFIADYLLQGKYMLGKFKEKEWELPLAAHCSVHAVFTFFIAYAFVTTSNAWQIALQCAIIDFVIHFTMDRIKASPKLWGRYESLDKSNYVGVAKMAEGDFLGVVVNEKDANRRKEWAKGRLLSNKYYYWTLGFDQKVHHLTDVLIIAIIMGIIQ